MKIGDCNNLKMMLVVVIKKNKAGELFIENKQDKKKPAKV